MSASSELKIVLTSQDNASKGIEGLNKGLGGLGGVAKVAAAGLAVVGVAGGALVGGLGAAVGMASSFQSVISEVGAVSGASGTELQGLSDLALQLGSTTAFSASEAAQAMAELAKGGIAVGDMAAVLPGTLDLAAAGGLGLAEAATIATDSMAIFSAQGVTMDQVANAFAGAANISSISVEDMASAMAYAGPAAAALGFTLEDTSAAIALLGANGIKGSSAGTGLRTVLTSLASPSKEAAALMNELGINVFDAQGKMLDMGGISEELKGALSGMSDAQRIATLETLAGKEGMSTLIALMGEGDNSIQSYTDKLKNAATAHETGVAMMDNFAGSMDALKGAVETAGITLGLALLPALRQVVDAATAGVNAAMPFIQAWGPKLAAGIQSGIAAVPGFFTSMISTVQGAMDSVAEALGIDPSVFTASLGGLVDQAGAIFDAVKARVSTAIQGVKDTISGVFSGLAAQFPTLMGPLQTAFSAIAPMLGPVAAAFVGLGPAVSILGAVLPPVIAAFTSFGPILGFLTSTLPLLGTMIGAIGAPLLLAGAAVAALAVAWTQNWGGIRDSTMPVITAIGGFITGSLLPALTQIGSFLTSTVLPAFMQFGAMVGTAIQGALPGLQQFGAILMGGVGGALQVITPLAQILGQTFATQMPAITALWTQFQAALQPVVPLVEAVATILGAVLVGAVGVVMGVLGGLIGLFAGALPGAVQAASGILEAFGGAIQTVSALVSGVVNVVSALLRGDWAQAWEAAKTAVSGMAEGVMSIVSGMTTAIAGVLAAGLDGAAGFVIGFVDTIIGFFQNLANVLVGNSIVPDMVTAIIASFQEMIATVAGAVAGWVGEVIGFFTNLGTQGAQLVTTMATTITTLFTTLVTTVSAALTTLVTNASQAWTAIQSAAATAWAAIQTTVSNAAEAVRSAVESKFNEAKSAATTAFEGAKSAVSTAMSGMESAVSTGVGNVLGFFSGLPGKITGAIGDLSGLLVNAGRSVIQGLLDGINSMIGAVTSKLSELTGLIPQLKGPPAKDKVLLFENGQLIIGGLIDGIDSKVPALATQLGKITDGIGSLLGEAIGTFGQISAGGDKTLTAVMRKVRDDIKQAFDTLTTGMQEAIERAQQNVSTAKGLKLEAEEYLANMEAAARAFAQGAALQGIGPGSGSIGAGQAIGNGIAEGVRQALDIRSPSKVMEEIGGQVMAGLQNGIDAGEPAVVKAAAEAASAVASALSAMTDALTKASAFNGSAGFGGLYAVGKGIKAAIADFQVIVEDVTQDAADIAGKLGEAVGKVASGIGAAADALTKAATYVAPADFKGLYALGKAVRAAVADWAIVAEQVGTEGATAAATFAEQAGKVVGVIGSAVENLLTLADWKPIAREVMADFTATIIALVRGIAEGTKGLTAEGLTLAGQFGEAAQKIVGFIGDGVKGITGLATFIAPPRVTLDALLETIRYVVGRFGAISGILSTEGLTQTTAFGEAAQKALGAVKSGVDAFAILDATNMPTGGKLDDLTRAIRETMQKVAAAAAIVGTEGIAQAQAFGTAASAIFSALKSGLDLFKQIDAPGGWPTTDWLQPLIELMQGMLSRGGILLGQAQQLKGIADSFAATMGGVGQGFNTGIAAGANLGSLAPSGVGGGSYTGNGRGPGQSGSVILNLTVTGNTMLSRDTDVARQIADVVGPQLRRTLGYRDSAMGSSSVYFPG